MRRVIRRRTETSNSAALCVQRTACDKQSCGDNACALHKVAWGLFVSVISLNLIVGFLFCLVRRCATRSRGIFNAVAVQYITFNGSIATAAAVLVCVVENLLCPDDGAILIIAAVFTFVVLCTTGIAATVVMTSGHQLVPLAKVEDRNGNRSRFQRRRANPSNEQRVLPQHADSF